MLNRLTDTLGFQAEALQLRAERHKLIASNIANADTPGYHARDFDFAAALRAASSGAATRAVAQTHAAHVDQPAHAQADAHLKYALPSQTSLDGNSVDMDRERAAFADNAVKYEATLRFVNGSVRTMLDAIRGQ
jgi:flagellar basal-body rod protein FlgB